LNSRRRRRRRRCNPGCNLKAKDTNLTAVPGALAGKSKRTSLKRCPFNGGAYR
jgi:hypothetical protein